MTGEAPLKAAIHRPHNSARNHAPLVREYALMTPQDQRVLAQRDEPKARAAVSRLVPPVKPNFNSFAVVSLASRAQAFDFA